MTGSRTFGTATRGPLVFASRCFNPGPSWPPAKSEHFINQHLTNNNQHGSTTATAAAAAATAEGSCKQEVHVLGLQSELVIGIAFTSFIIGVALMASIWLIYIKTGAYYILRSILVKNYEFYFRLAQN